MFGLFETGFQFFYWGNLIMLLIGGTLIYLGISKKMEPLLLVPIGFGMLLINLPLGGLMDYELQVTNTTGAPAHVISIDVDESSRIGEDDVILTLDSGEVLAPVHGRLKEVLVSPGEEIQPGEVLVVMITTAQTPLPTEPVGLLSRIFQYGIMWQVIPPLIFLCLGALTDFGPMIANPKTLLLGAAAQFGVYFAFFAALAFGFTIPEACLCCARLWFHHTGGMLYRDNRGCRRSHYHLRYLSSRSTYYRGYCGSLLYLYGAGTHYPAANNKVAHHQERAGNIHETATACSFHAGENPVPNNFGNYRDTICSYVSSSDWLFHGWEPVYDLWCYRSAKQNGTNHLHRYPDHIPYALHRCYHDGSKFPPAEDVVSSHSGRLCYSYRRRCFNGKTHESLFQGKD